MDILAAINQCLSMSDDVRQILRGGIWLNHVDQNAARPNIMLQLMGGSDSMTHQGPDGLNHSTVRIYYRGDTDIDATRLGRAATARLHGFRGIVGEIAIQLSRRTNTTSDFNEPATVQRQIDSYVVSWRYRG